MAATGLDRDELDLVGLPATITEAGGRVGTLTGDDYKLGPHIIGGSPKVYTALAALLAPHVTEKLRA